MKIRALGNSVFCRQSALLLCCLLAACTSNGVKIDQRAASLGLERTLVLGLSYHHVIYANARAQAIGEEPLVIFLEGDGRPWGTEGRLPASDPTTSRPLALELLGRTALPAAYITRPCYHQLDRKRCNSSLWTSERYAAPLVQSMANAIETYASQRSAPSLLLVGYSGGGTLAVLLAERLPRVVGVITLGANLDVSAWTEHHRYLPLTGSLNPAESTAPHPWPELHLQGGQDAVVPPATTSRYFTVFPQAERWVFNDFGHVCCWLEEWPQVIARALTLLEQPPPGSP